MTKGQRTLATLLAIIAALLAAHLAVLSGNEAHAQSPPDQPGPPTTEPQEPHVVGITAINDTHSLSSQTPRYLYRLWSDGVIEQNRFRSSAFNGCNCWQGWKVVLVK